MLNPIIATQNYLAPLWTIFEPEIPPMIQEGDLIGFDDYYGDYIGCGIIKAFTTARFKNMDTGEFENLPCAIVVPAHSGAQWLDYIPLTHMGTLQLNNYLEIYEEEYAEKLPNMQILRQEVITRMSFYSGADSSSNLSSLQNDNNSLPVGA